MTNRNIRTLFATALAVTTLGLATGANAASQNPGFDKASQAGQAQPAAQAVAAQAEPITTGPTEKANRTSTATPAFGVTTRQGQQIATVPTAPKRR